jgi:tRNA modification GTPase
MFTPITAGAIAVVQVAGPRALPIAEAIFRPASGRSLSQYAPGQMAYGEFMDAGGTVVDGGLAVWGGSGKLAWVDFNLHGGVRIVQRVIRRLTALGAELRAGEDSARGGSWPYEWPGRQRHLAASLRVKPIGKNSRAGPRPCPQATPLDHAFDWLCPLERSIQACLARAATPRVVEWLIRQGVLWRELLADWQRRLAAVEGASVLVEAQGLLDQMDLSDAWRGRALAILGLANAGKSTIANRLAGRAVSLVADVPGTTRDWVGEPIGLLGWPVWMVDTAGLRQSEDPVQTASAARAAEQAGAADLRLLVIDGTGAPREGQHFLAAAAGLRSCDVVAYTKCDLPTWRRPEGDETGVLPGAAGVCVSGLTGAGWSGLERALVEGLGFSALQEPKPLVFCAEVQMGVAHMVSAIRARKPAAALAVARRLTAMDAASGSDGHAESAG